MADNNEDIGYKIYTVVSNDVSKDNPNKEAMLLDAANMAPSDFAKKWGEEMRKSASGWLELSKEVAKLDDRKSTLDVFSEGYPTEMEFETAYRNDTKKGPLAGKDSTAGRYYVDERRAKERFDAADAERKKSFTADSLAREGRKKDLNTWYWNMILPDDVKRRYIDTPEKSSLYQYKMAAENNEPWYKYWLRSPLNLDELSIALGTIGTGMDFLPNKLGIVAGPTVRLLREGALAKFDDDYDKSFTDVVRQATADYILNGMTNWRPTRQVNVQKDLEKGVITDILGKDSKVVKQSAAIDAAADVDKLSKTANELSSDQGGDALEAMMYAASDTDKFGKPKPREILDIGTATDVARNFKENLKYEEALRDAVSEAGHSEGVGKLYESMLKNPELYGYGVTPSYADAVKEYTSLLKTGEITTKGLTGDLALKKLPETMTTMRGGKPGLNESAVKHTQDVVGKSGSNYRRLIEEAGEPTLRAKALNKAQHATRGAVLGAVKAASRGTSRYGVRSTAESIMPDSDAKQQKTAVKDRKYYATLIEDLQDQWERGFKPNKEPGNDIWEAYQIWLKSQGGK